MSEELDQIARTAAKLGVQPLLTLAPKARLEAAVMILKGILLTDVKAEYRLVLFDKIASKVRVDIEENLKGKQPDGQEGNRRKGGRAPAKKEGGRRPKPVKSR